MEDCITTCRPHTGKKILSSSPVCGHNIIKKLSHAGTSHHELKRYFPTTYDIIDSFLDDVQLQSRGGGYKDGDNIKSFSPASKCHPHSKLYNYGIEHTTVAFDEMKAIPYFAELRYYKNGKQVDSHYCPDRVFPHTIKKWMIAAWADDEMKEVFPRLPQSKLYIEAGHGARDPRPTLMCIDVDWHDTDVNEIEKAEIINKLVLRFPTAVIEDSPRGVHLYVKVIFYCSCVQYNNTLSDLQKDLRDISPRIEIKGSVGNRETGKRGQLFTCPKINTIAKLNNRAAINVNEIEVSHGHTETTCAPASPVITYKPSMEYLHASPDNPYFAKLPYVLHFDNIDDAYDAYSQDKYGVIDQDDERMAQFEKDYNRKQAGQLDGFEDWYGAERINVTLHKDAYNMILPRVITALDNHYKKLHKYNWRSYSENSEINIITMATILGCDYYNLRYRKIENNHYIGTVPLRFYKRSLEINHNIYVEIDYIKTIMKRLYRLGWKTRIVTATKGRANIYMIENPIITKTEKRLLKNLLRIQNPQNITLRTYLNMNDDTACNVTAPSPLGDREEKQKNVFSVNQYHLKTTDRLKVNIIKTIESTTHPPPNIWRTRFSKLIENIN